MDIEHYPVPPASAAQSKECLARHFAAPRESWQFASDDIQEPVTFATIVTVDALAPVMLALAKAELAPDRTLASGWSYRRIDLGDPKHVDLMFTAPGGQIEVFVFRMKPSRHSTAKIDKVSAYLFTDRKYWLPSKMETVVETLKKRGSRPATFEYAPQSDCGPHGSSLMAHGPFKKLEPEGTLRVLPPLVEALSSFDPQLFAACVSSHSNAVYQTLFEELRIF